MLLAASDVLHNLMCVSRRAAGQLSRLILIGSTQTQPNPNLTLTRVKIIVGKKEKHFGTFELYVALMGLDCCRPFSCCLTVHCPGISVSFMRVPPALVGRSAELVCHPPKVVLIAEITTLLMLG